jgi:hypothetical protein
MPSLTRWWIKRWLVGSILCAGALHAGPVEFGMAELNAAIDARNFKYKPKIMAELNIEAPETFRIEPYAAGGAHITGGDLRGLMYGLLEAAGQMRSAGRFKLTHGVPALALRGVKITAQPAAAGVTSNLLASIWFTSSEFWQSYFESMARDRFNRLEIAFDSAPESDALPALRNITQIAQQYGVDVAIGFGAPDTRAIEQLLRNCSAVRTVTLHGDRVPDSAELLQTLHAAGRRVVLELPDNENTAGLIEAAGQSGAPLRLFSEYTPTAWNPRPRDSYWEMDAAQGADAVNAISGAGFEVVSPLDASGQPALDFIAAWGRLGFTRAVQQP